jgi:hypothetical protein
VKVAALYIDPRGPYPGLGVDCWDETRDARKYNGPLPVVVHPPCGPWGGLRHLYRGNEHDCAPIAVGQVRAFGGVLEHPAYSKLWAHCSLPLPGAAADSWGGYTVQVDQCDWGHVARKSTWLYCIGIDRARVELDIAAQRGSGTPTHWVSGRRVPYYYPDGRKSSSGLMPPGIKVCSAQQRRRSPQAFAQWLIALASEAKV